MRRDPTSAGRSGARRRPGRGFTLVELLVATVIISLIMLGVYRAFGASFDAWNRTESEHAALCEARAFLQTLGAELRCLAVLGEADDGPPFALSQGSLSFCTTATLGDRSIAPSLGVTRVSYEVVESGEPGRRAVTVSRSRRFLSGALPITPEEQAVVLSDARDVQFLCQSGEAEDGTLQWSSTWEDDRAAPGAVRVAVAMGAGSQGGREWLDEFEGTFAICVRTPPE